jgi:uncharacterized protein (DUF2141 family)
MKNVWKFSFFGMLLLIGQSLSAVDLEVEILNRKQENSKISCAVFEKELGFPSEPDKKLIGDIAKLESGKTVCRFVGLTKKSYAVSVLEDLNGNGKMDTNLVGFPQEPWGVSNDAPMQTFGPPKFSEALFVLGENKRIQIKLNQSK